jgi:integrase/recombinase XerD
MRTGSLLEPLITDYVALHQALGKGFDGEHRVLRELNRWLAQTGAADLTAETFTAWCKTKQHLASGVRRRHMGIVRNFCLYRHRRDPHCFVPDLLLFPAFHQPRSPYIFSKEDISRLLQVADRLDPTSASPLRAQVYRLAIVLLYTTGLRRGELVRLTVGDYAPHERTLLVRQSKFHKSRSVPLSDATVVEMNAYLDWRRRHQLPISPQTPLMWNRHHRGKAYTGAGLAQGLRHLFRLAEVRAADARLPRVHDLRHSFAVHALWRWYQADVNVRAKLPLLATYMGHVSIHSTEYYLPFIEVLAAAASERFAAHYGVLVTPWAGTEGETS